MKEYSYLVNGPGRTNVLSEAVKSLDQLAMRPVIYNMARSSYLLFDSLNEFLEFYEKDTARTYCEVIWGEMPQKLKLDVDAAGATITEEDLAAAVKDATEIAIYKLWPDIRPDIYICPSSGPTKISFHVIVDAYVNNNHQCAAFTKIVCDILPEEYAKYIDVKVNNSKQNLRLAGSHKPNCTRVKQLPPGIPLEKTLIRCYTGAPETLPDIVAINIPVVTKIEDNDAIVAEVLQKFTGVMTGCAFIGSLKPAGFYAQLNFKRVSPSYCQLCTRVHDHDNTLKLLISEPAGGKVIVYQGCRHKEKNLMPLGEVNTDIPDTVTPADRLDAILSRAITNGAANSNITKFDSLKSKIIYDEPVLRDFMVNSPTICVRARMKMGKTKKLREMLDKYYSSAIPARIVMLSFRQTFSGNIKQAFPEFTLYSDIHGELRDNRVIVQVESLHRLTTGDPVDLFIMDECESILSQFSSGLIKDFSHTWAIFTWLMRYSSRVICMDAYLSDRTFNVLEAMRPEFTESGHYHHCVYKNATNDIYNITHNRALWFGLLIDILEAGNKVAIPISSLTEARGLESQLRAKFPNRIIKLYSSETSRAEARTHFADVSKYWSRIDILIYTPTVSAGVSFELQHFDYLFGFFVHTSCDAQTAHQMIGRIRDIKTHRLYIYIAPGKTNALLTREGIRNSLTHRRLDLMRDYDANFITFNIGRHGNYELMETNYLKLWIENALVVNQSRMNYANIFANYAKESGAVCQILDIIDLLCVTITDKNDLIRTGEAAISEHKEKKVEIALVRAESIADATEIDAPTAAEIKQSISLQQEVSIEDKHAYEKYKLRSNYKYTAHLTVNFVLSYIAPTVKQIYRNLSRICAAGNEAAANGLEPTPENTLQIIQKQEREQLLRFTAESPVDEVNNTYWFTHHKTAHVITRMCGWSSPFVLDYKAPIEIMYAAGEQYWQIINNICLEFHIKPPARQVVATLETDSAVSVMIKPLSVILSKIYGITICCSRGSWYLKQSNLFKIVGPPGDQTVVLTKT